MRATAGMPSYLWQATWGQLSLINRARPLEQVIRDERTPQKLKELLQNVPQIKKWAEGRGLKATRNYESYTALNREAAVWVVTASRKLKFEAKEWSFPIAGSFPYLGWFDIRDARALAKELTDEGWDADVRGASAYSTLGWFKDPILSSMIDLEDEAALGGLANVLIHESVHATVYVKGEASFNESLASFVADTWTPQWLAVVRGPQSRELESYVESEKKHERRAALLKAAYDTLEALYASSRSDAEKFEEKARVLAKLKTDLGLKRDPNNALLINYKTYQSAPEQWGKLLAKCEGDWSAFLSWMKRLDASSFQKGALESSLEALFRESCR